MMDRRTFLSSSAALAAPLSAAQTANSWYELIRIRMRTGDPVFANRFFPAWRRLSLGPAGFFSSMIAEQSPFVLILLSYPALSAFAEHHRLLAQYEDPAETNYVRIESSLLHAFDGMPQIAMPSGQRHIFELRTYESRNAAASARKIRMFNEGEIGIFQRLGMAPVFFGQNIIGSNLPSLTYMLAFEDLAAREKLWKAFVNDPEWKKMSARPELSDKLLVSNISNAILQPLPFSQIK